jgi:hypothetical protein
VRIDREDVQGTIKNFLKEMQITKENPMCGHQLSYIFKIESCKVFKALTGLTRFNIVDFVEYNADDARKISGNRVNRRTRFYFLSL